MAAAALIALATLLLEDDDLLILLVLEDGSLNGCAFNERCTETYVRAFADHEDFIEIDAVASFCTWERVYLEYVTFRDSKLAALSSDCGFHDKLGKGGEESVLTWEIKKFLGEFFGFINALQKVWACGA